MFKRVERLKKIIAEINSVWQQYDQLNNWIGVIWLIEKQLDEIKQANYTGEAVLNEAADILIILIRYLHKIGVDPEKLIFHRLNTRHRGKVREICEKYDKIWREERHGT